MSSFNHEHVSTSTTINDRVINGCILQKKTTKEFIHLQTFQVASNSLSFTVTYQKNLEIRHGDLEGHKFKIALQRPDPVRELECDFNPRVQFIDPYDQVMIVLSEMHLPPYTQERLVRYISTELVNISSRHSLVGGGGYKVEVNVKVNVDCCMRIGCCNKGKKDSSLAETDCPVCLTKLSSAESRMELQCSHVFHRDCVIKWLKKNPSCPICRTNILGKTVFIY
ncbi:BnaA02g09350D [Brassica napus]|uniref:BnaA02g09350D protein n=1 Tax=Brassica napus TaxID=3708 RepID=A0A078G2Q7_BRANA|nr:BnaA02g09350D [Brassica napus]